MNTITAQGPFEVAMKAQGPFEVAMNAALLPGTGEKKKLKIFDHHFNVKPVEISRNTPSEGKITVIGHISHHLSWRPDDQVYYRITKEGGDKVLEIERKINRGGFAGIAAPFIAAAGTYLTGRPIPPDKVEEIGRGLGKAVEGSWESAADFLIANVALRAK